MGEVDERRVEQHQPPILVKHRKSDGQMGKNPGQRLQKIALRDFGMYHRIDVEREMQPAFGGVMRVHFVPMLGAAFAIADAGPLDVRFLPVDGQDVER